MDQTISKFESAYRKALTKDRQRGAIFRGTQNVNVKRQTAFDEIDDTLPGGIELLKQRGAAIKDEALAHLDKYLEQFADNVERSGGQVHFAVDAAEARQIVSSILKDAGAKRVVKSKSMVTEEIGLNDALEADGCEVVESDLGEFILQQGGDHPSHIVLPAIHIAKDDVAALFNRLYETPLDADADLLAQQARRVIREKFLNADAGISGANFAVAETGTIAIVENEGNARLTTSAPPLHIAVVGIEKIVPRLEDVAVLARLLSRAATGQKATVYLNLITGSRRANETDGPTAMHVVFVDNGRTKVLADREMRPSLRCIRCAACLNTCPVYQQIGGHAYGWVYGGPIGSVLDPALLGLKDTKSLPFASSLCGACGEVCPVKIPLPQMLVTLRARSVDEGMSPAIEATAMSGFAATMTHPGLYRAGAAAASRLAPQRAGVLMHLPVPPLSFWQQVREMPAPSPRSFRALWADGLKDETVVPFVEKRAAR